MKLIRISLLVLSVLLLAACATAPIVQLPSQLAPTHGYVYVNLPKWQPGQVLILKEVRSGEEHSLQMRDGSSMPAAGLWVPQGDYRLHKWDGYELKEDYPVITVKSGRITDLGTIVPFSIGGYEFVFLPFRHPETAPYVQAAIAQYRQWLSSADPLEWQVTTIPKAQTIRSETGNMGLIVALIMEYERHVNKPSANKQLRAAQAPAEFLRLAMATAAPQTDESATDAEGNLYFGADFGQVRVRSKSGEWSALSTGSIYPVTSVEVWNSTLYAGMEDGTIRASSDQGKTWKLVVKVGNEAIIDIDRVGKRWMLISASRIANQYGSRYVRSYSVHTTVRDDLSELVSVKQQDLPIPNFITSLRGEATTDAWFLLVPGAEFWRVDAANASWQAVTLPSSTSDFHVSPDGSVIAVYLSQGIFSKLFITQDQGKTWKRYDNPPLIITDIHFTTPTKGVATRWSPGMFSGVVEILDYDAREDKWKKKIEAPQDCARVLRGTNNEYRLCVTRGGSILWLNEQDVWQAEFVLD